MQHLKCCCTLQTPFFSSSHLEASPSLFLSFSFLLLCAPLCFLFFQLPFSLSLSLLTPWLPLTPPHHPTLATSLSAGPPLPADLSPSLARLSLCQLFPYLSIPLCASLLPLSTVSSQFLNLWGNGYIWKHVCLLIVHVF